MYFLDQSDLFILDIIEPVQRSDLRSSYPSVFTGCPGSFDQKDHVPRPRGVCFHADAETLNDDLFGAFTIHRTITKLDPI